MAAASQSTTSYLVCNNTNRRWNVTDIIADRSSVLRDWKHARQAGGALPLNFCEVVVQAWVTRASCKHLSLETLFEAVRVRFVLGCSGSLVVVALIKLVRSGEEQNSWCRWSG